MSMIKGMLFVFYPGSGGVKFTDLDDQEGIVQTEKS